MARKRKATGSSTEAAPSTRRSKRKSAAEAPSEPPPPMLLAGEDDDDGTRFIGEPIPAEEALSRWPHRYRTQSVETKLAGSKRKREDDSKETTQAKRHYSMAEVDDGTMVFNLDDDAHVKAEEGQEDYICRIVELFEDIDGSRCFTAQWYYRSTDTVITTCYKLDKKRVFLSEVKDVNLLNSLTKKLNIVRLPSNEDLSVKEEKISNCDFYCDMTYGLPYSSFTNLQIDNVETEVESDSTISSEVDEASGIKPGSKDVSCNDEIRKPEMKLLDLYAGCGAMSTGLCLGSSMCGVNLVTKWAVDFNEYACQSLKYNHPETQVRNETAEDFLSLLKAWEVLCAKYSLIGSKDAEQDSALSLEDEDTNDDGGENDGVYEVKEILNICHGDPKNNGERCLYLKVRWKGYDEDADSWEPFENLGDCEERIKEFVTKGHKSKTIPLPGDVDVICGGPPCQGISGFNRFRDKENPLEDPKNKQLEVFMNIVEFLKPRFVLMENVVDLVKFSDGFLGRYALGRLVGLKYQARLGLMAAGAYGLPQYRMRVFLWGAHPAEKLPQFPIPTHNVVKRGVTPSEFETSVVAYSDGRQVELEKELYLEDAISDLPVVENSEERDQMPYGSEPKNDFQRFIRLRKDGLQGLEVGSEVSEPVLFDHRPLRLNDDDYHRVCEIPKKKGANFRHLRGVRVGPDNKVEWDSDVERVFLPTGKPLVPDYAMSFVKGTSSKPFGRLWWDETVSTVVTRAEPHNQAILHPLQDRVLTVRENARLQGFPDHYRLFGPIKQRYMQVGNAVAVPVTRALGYALAVASQGVCDEEPLLTLPKNFPNILKGDTGSKDRIC